MLSFATRLVGAALLLAGASAARAQSAPTNQAYTGPTYPGGPDSLRALVYRSTRQTAPAPAGKTLVLFELDDQGRPGKFQLVTPPGRLNAPLLRASATAVQYLQEQMAGWHPGERDPKAKRKAEPLKNALLLDFSDAPLSARPYSYADQLPRFPALANALGSRELQYVDPPLTTEAEREAFISSVKGLVLYTQMQVRYPVEALRNQQQGRVYVSFEVAESGAIEHAEILGTAAPALDAEVMRIVQRFPAAGAPALLQGRPVRMHYALPITFRIQ